MAGWVPGGYGRKRLGPVVEEVRQHSDSASKAWMITFSDLISLMLTFFVMLFAMSNVNLDQWKNITDTLSRSLDPKPIVDEPETPTTAPFNIGSISFKSGTSLGYLSSVLHEVLTADPVLRDSYLLDLNDRLVISIPGEGFFKPGTAELGDSARTALFQISGVIRNIENKIVVEAYTDRTPPKVKGIASNWELSLARADAVSSLLKKSGVLQEIDALGYGDSRYNSLESNDSAMRARLANRIDLIIHPGVGRTSP